MGLILPGASGALQALGSDQRRAPLFRISFALAQELPSAVLFSNVLWHL